MAVSDQLLRWMMRFILTCRPRSQELLVIHGQRTQLLRQLQYTYDPESGLQLPMDNSHNCDRAVEGHRLRSSMFRRVSE